MDFLEDSHCSFPLPRTRKGRVVIFSSPSVTTNLVILGLTTRLCDDSEQLGGLDFTVP